MKRYATLMAVILSALLGAGQATFAKGHHKKIDESATTQSATTETRTDVSADENGTTIRKRTHHKRKDANGTTRDITTETRQDNVVAPGTVEKRTKTELKSETTEGANLVETKRTRRHKRLAAAPVETPTATPTAPSGGAGSLLNRMFHQPAPSAAPVATPATTGVSVPAATDNGPTAADIAAHPGMVYVHGYTRKDGVVVHGYWRHKERVHS